MKPKSKQMLLKTPVLLIIIVLSFVFLFKAFFWGKYTRYTQLTKEIKKARLELSQTRQRLANLKRMQPYKVNLSEKEEAEMAFKKSFYAIFPDGTLIFKGSKKTSAGLATLFEATIRIGPSLAKTIEKCEKLASFYPILYTKWDVNNSNIAKTEGLLFVK